MPDENATDASLMLGNTADDDVTSLLTVIAEQLEDVKQAQGELIDNQAADNSYLIQALGYNDESNGLDITSQREVFSNFESAIADDHSDMITALRSIDGKLTQINGTLGEMATGTNSPGGSSLDYTSQLADLNQNLVYTNMLLIAVLLFVVVGSGLILGGQVTKWMKLR